MEIKKQTIIRFILLFFFIEPSYFQTIPEVHKMYNVMQILVTILLALSYIFKKRKPSTIVFLIWFMMLEMIFSCSIGLGNINSTVNAYLCYVGLSMWLDINIRIDAKDTLNLLVLLLDVYVIINFISLIMYPNGMFISQSFQNTPYVCWFLGYKNPQMRLLLPYIVLLFTRDSIFYTKIKKITYIKLFLIVLISLKLKSATGIFGVFTFLILNLLFANKNNSKLKEIILKVLNIKTIFLVFIAINILVVLFQFQNNFSFIIVNLLHKDLDLTDRIYVWQSVIPVIKNNFIFGQGVIYAELSRNYIGASHAHNYFLNIFYNGGLVLFILTSLIWIIAGDKSAKYNKSLGVRYLKFMAIIFLIMGITESLTLTVLLYPILILISYSDILEKIECSGGNYSEEN